MLRTYILYVWIINGFNLRGHFSSSKGELSAPQYISPWVWMDTSNSSTTEHIFLHNLNDNPIKAEVQVRKNGSEMIFPGIKSANVIQGMHRPLRAGVLCIYNKTHVRVMGPQKKENIDSSLIYIGDSSKWRGYLDSDAPFERSERAEVRVRVWHRDDFPKLDFVTNITLRSNQTYLQIPHNVSRNSNIYVTAQLMFNDGWIGEAQGSESNYAVNSTARGGGIVFAISHEDFKVWAPQGNPRGVIFTYYGWGSCGNISQCSYNSTTVHITLWRTIPHSTCSEFGKHREKRSDFPHNKFAQAFNVDRDLIEAFVRIAAKVSTVDFNRGKASLGQRDENQYSFFSTGAVMMAIDQSATGLVYGYNNDTKHIMIWHPNESGTKYIVKMESSDSYTWFTATSDDIFVCFWKSLVRKTTTTESQDIPTIDTTASKLPTQLNCTFLIFGTCIELSDLGTNILVDFSEIENNYLLFTCKQGYPSHSGDFNRTFHVENGSLSGQTPVCKERNPLRTNIEIEERVKEIVKKLTIPVNSTAKYRRSLQSALDRRTSSRVIGIIAGLAIGGLIALIVLNDMVRFFRFMSTR